MAMILRWRPRGLLAGDTGLGATGRLSSQSWTSSSPQVLEFGPVSCPGGKSVYESSSEG